MKKKRKNVRDLSMYLFSNEEMKGTNVPQPPVKEDVVPATITETKKEEVEEENVTLLDNPNTSFEIDSRILTKEMFFAIRHLKRLDVNQVRMLAMEMAMVWQNGKNQKESYTLQSMPDMQMDYHQFIAYYYCSFNMAFPNMMNKLQLPYEKEFQNAMYDFGAKHGGAF